MIHTQTHLPDKLLLVHHHAHGMWFAASRSLQATNESTGYDWLTSGRNHRRGHRHTPHSSWSFLPLCRRSVFTLTATIRYYSSQVNLEVFLWVNWLQRLQRRPLLTLLVQKLPVHSEPEIKASTWTSEPLVFIPTDIKQTQNTESLRRSVFRSDM